MSTLEVLFKDKWIQRDRVALLIPSYDGQEKLSQLSYGQFGSAVERLSHRIGQLIGGGNGQAEESVSLVLPNSLEFIGSFLALVNRRFSVSPLNPNSTEAEIHTNLSDLKSLGIVVPMGHQMRKFVALQEAIRAARQLNLFVLEVGWRDSNELEVNVVVRSARIITSPGQIVPLMVNSQSDDVALVLQTSGTTSKPKVVPLTHRNILTSLKNIVTTYNLNPLDRLLVVMPLFHVHGLIGALFSTLFSQGSALIPLKFSAGKFLDHLLNHNCTWYTAVPTIHKILLSKKEFLDLSRLNKTSFSPLRFVRSCSSSLAPATLLQLEATFKVSVLEAYAMTEAAHQMTSNPLPPAQHKSASVGIAQGVHVGIYDDDNRPQPTGAGGEVCIWGDNVTSGYVGNPEANRKNFFHHGGQRWFRTGDQGYLDNDGYLYLTGRLKEMINRGGEKIAPLEIDAVLLQHPSVAEAVAFPLPHPLYGEEVYAAVVLKTDVDETQLKQFCSKHLAAFKCPKKIFVTTKLPQTATGKIQRRHVADHFSTQLTSQPQLVAKL